MPRASARRIRLPSSSSPAACSQPPEASNAARVQSTAQGGEKCPVSQAASRSCPGRLSAAEGGRAIHASPARS